MIGLRIRRFCLLSLIVVAVGGQLKTFCENPANQHFIFLLNGGTNAQKCSDGSLQPLAPRSNYGEGCGYFDEVGRDYYYLMRQDDVDQSVWDMCDQKNLLNVPVCQIVNGCIEKDGLAQMTICQIVNGCVEKDGLAQMTNSHRNQTCQEMSDKLTIDQRTELFINPDHQCDFYALQRKIDFSESFLLNWQLSMQLPGSTHLEMSPRGFGPPDFDISMCRHGIHEQVFYNETGIPTHCVINFEHHDKGKCLPIQSLYDAISELAGESKLQSRDDSTNMYRSYIIR
uniref:Uncharacterized protein n=1 Tax=Romanomermis culicivorax TaxID=13658 RepID=A0A915IHG6_ROMCU